jgi:hypothetical protein
MLRPLPFAFLAQKLHRQPFPAEKNRKNLRGLFPECDQPEVRGIHCTILHRNVDSFGKHVRPRDTSHIHPGAQGPAELQNRQSPHI